MALALSSSEARVLRNGFKTPEPGPSELRVGSSATIDQFGRELLLQLLCDCKVDQFPEPGRWALHEGNELAVSVDEDPNLHLSIRSWGPKTHMFLYFQGFCLECSNEAQNMFWFVFTFPSICKETYKTLIWDIIGKHRMDSLHAAHNAAYLHELNHIQSLLERNRAGYLQKTANVWMWELA